MSGTGRISIGRELSVAMTAATMLVLIYVSSPSTATCGGSARSVGLDGRRGDRARGRFGGSGRSSCRTRPVIEGVIVIALVFVLLVVSFSIVYYTLEHHTTNAVRRPQHQARQPLLRGDHVWPRSGSATCTRRVRLARGLVTLQIVFDFAFLGLTLRVVTSAARHAAWRPGPGRPPRRSSPLVK